MSANIYQSFLVGKIPKEEKGNFWGMIGKYEQIDLPKMIEGKFWWSKIKTWFMPTYVKKKPIWIWLFHIRFCHPFSNFYWSPYFSSIGGGCDKSV